MSNLTIEKMATTITKKPPTMNQLFKKTPMGKIWPIWLSAETELHEVPRWSPYLEKNPKLRTQKTGQHVLSAGLAAQIVLLRLVKYASYDRLLILSAFQLHDLPEGFIGIDKPAPKKTDEDDLREYFAFTERFHHFPADIYGELEQAYLLQFARKCPECFPEKAKLVMKNLQKTNPLDVKLFPALESWEYAFYAHEAWKTKGIQTVLTHVLRNQIPKLKSWYPELPGFREEVFTPEYESWAEMFLKRHYHIPDQKIYFGR